MNSRRKWRSRRRRKRIKRNRRKNEGKGGKLFRAFMMKRINDKTEFMRLITKSDA